MNGNLTDIYYEITYHMKFNHDDKHIITIFNQAIKSYIKTHVVAVAVATIV